jgi:hypothetical protein
LSNNEIDDGHRRRDRGADAAVSSARVGRDARRRAGPAVELKRPRLPQDVGAVGGQDRKEAVGWRAGDPGLARRPIVLVKPGSAGPGGNGQVGQKDVAATPGIEAITRCDKVGTLVDGLHSPVTPRLGTARRCGRATADEDPTSTTSAKLPRRILALIALSFTPLTLAFRTISDPSAGCVADVLSIVVAYGVLTAIFQSACSAVCSS